MSTLFVGDVHGCAAELERLLDAAPADRVVLVGDLYTKGPDPAGVWALVRDRGLLVVRGNHDQRLQRVIDGERPRDRHGHEVVEALDRADPAWRHHLAHLPLTLEVDGWTVVHAALHPSGDLARTTEEDCLVRRHWPRGDRTAPRWWNAYTGERRVVFGHDAIMGRVEVHRGESLHVVGLDSGCVYGGELTGFSVPEERFVTVPAARVYKPVG